MKLRFYALFCTLVFTSCNIINPDEKEPAFIQVENYILETGAGEGTASEKITEMWVNANDNMLSICTPGAQVPVLDLGNTKISVFAGIKNNGISSMRIFYPFYEAFDTVIYFTPFSYHKISPRFRYHPNALVDATRDFESGTNFQSYGFNEGYFTLVNDSAIAFEGNRCAKAYLDTGSYMLFKDDNEIDIESGKTVFLEMNYSCNQTFNVGVVSTVGGATHTNAMVSMAPTTSGTTPVWNKIYIDLGTVGLLYPSASAHNLYIECVKTGSEPPVIFLDNLKIVKWQ